MNDGPEGPANPGPSSSLSEEEEVDSESELAAKKRDILKYIFLVWFCVQVELNKMMQQ